MTVFGWRLQHLVPGGHHPQPVALVCNQVLCYRFRMGKFLRNLIKGAASITLFPDQVEIVRLRRDFPKPRPAEDVWREDWNKIGADFRKVLSHEQKAR